MTDEYTELCRPSPVLFRPQPRGPQIYIESTNRRLHAGFNRVMRATGERVAGMPVVAPTGRVHRDRVRVSCGGMSGMIATRKDAVDQHLRRMRPQELEQLDAINEQIRELRRQRKALMHEAFRRGHQVTVKELVELAERQTRPAVVPVSEQELDEARRIRDAE